MKKRFVFVITTLLLISGSIFYMTKKNIIFAENLDETYTYIIGKSNVAVYKDTSPSQVTPESGLSNTTPATSDDLSSIPKVYIQDANGEILGEYQTIIVDGEAYLYFPETIITRSTPLPTIADPIYGEIVPIYIVSSVPSRMAVYAKDYITDHSSNPFPAYLLPLDPADKTLFLGSINSNFYESTPTGSSDSKRSAFILIPEKTMETTTSTTTTEEPTTTSVTTTEEPTTTESTSTTTASTSPTTTETPTASTAASTTTTTTETTASSTATTESTTSTTATTTTEATTTASTTSTTAAPTTSTSTTEAGTTHSVTTRPSDPKTSGTTTSSKPKKSGLPSTGDETGIWLAVLGGFTLLTAAYYYRKAQA